jgi:signal transduction histidine kinase
LKVCGETHDKNVISDHRNQGLDDAFQSQAGGSTADLRQQLADELIHEFTNAITAVIGYSKLALDGVEESHRAREWLEKIRSHSRQLGPLLNKLIDLKWSQHGEQP